MLRKKLLNGKDGQGVCVTYIVKSYVAICFVDMYLYLYLSTFKSTCILLKYFSKNNAMYLYLYFNKCESTCTLLKYFHMYFAPCLMEYGQISF